jgi:hypothetical protein
MGDFHPEAHVKGSFGLSFMAPISRSAEAISREVFGPVFKSFFLLKYKNPIGYPDFLFFLHKE